MLQAVQTEAGLGLVDCGVDEFNLVYTSIYSNQYGTSQFELISIYNYLRFNEVTNHEG